MRLPKHIMLQNISTPFPKRISRSQHFPSILKKSDTAMTVNLSGEHTTIIPIIFLSIPCAP